MRQLATGVIAVLFGLGLVFTQSSFKAANTTTRWGYIQSTNSFVDLTGKVEDDSPHPAHGTYSCVASSNICTGDDASMPTDPNQLTNQEDGNFRLNP